MILIDHYPVKTEKIVPLMRPIIDNLEQILDSGEEKHDEDENAYFDIFLQRMQILPLNTFYQG